MLITPVQPNNSLNNIIIQNQNCTENNQPDTSSKIQENNSFATKPPTPRIKKFPPRCVDGSVSAPKKSRLLEHKHQKTTRKPIPRKLKTSEDHDEEMTQRKLADIVKEYEQISKDKNILTAEIKNMKLYLTEIRSKLDQSLTVLKRNTKLFAIKSGIANSLLSSKPGRAKKIGPKKPKKKSEKNEKNKDSLDTNEFFLNKESLLGDSVSGIKYVNK